MPENFYSPFETQEEPAGHVLQGFYEEYELTVSGTVKMEKDFIPSLLLFMQHYKDRFPSWAEFINSYRHFIGLSYVYPQAVYQGAVIEGFRFDFDLFHDPCWLAVNDLDFNIPNMPPLSTESLFWMAFQAFFKQYRCEGPVDPTHFVSHWHQFLHVSSVCYNTTALSGDYKTKQVNSFEEVHRHYFPDEEFRKQYKSRLREFVEQMILEHDYFLPSHHFDAWVQSIEQDYHEYAEIIES